MISHSLFNFNSFFFLSQLKSRLYPIIKFGLLLGLLNFFILLLSLLIINLRLLVSLIKLTIQILLSRWSDFYFQTFFCSIILWLGKLCIINLWCLHYSGLLISILFIIYCRNICRNYCVQLIFLLFNWCC